MPVESVHTVLKAHENLKRDAYIRPPKNETVLQILGTPANRFQKAIRPLYGLSESLFYWCITLSAHHEKILGMKSSVLDPCLLFKHNKWQTDLQGLHPVLVDGILGTETGEFALDEHRTGDVF